MPISVSAHLHSDTGSRTFMYVNNYNFSKTRENTPSQKYFPSWMGSCHECDLYLLFGFPFMPKHLLPKHFQPIEWYETDRNASYLFGAFIRQFVKNRSAIFCLKPGWKTWELVAVTPIYRSLGSGPRTSPERIGSPISITLMEQVSKRSVK